MTATHVCVGSNPTRASNVYPGSLTGKHHHAVIMYQVENTGPTPVPGALIFLKNIFTKELKFGKIFDII